MNKDKNLLGPGIIGVAVVFIFIHIVLINYGLAILNPFYSFFLGVSEIVINSGNISSISPKYLAVVIMYFPLFIMGIYYLLNEKNIKEGVSKNLYFEYRQWNFFWGWFFDGKEEVQKILTHFNLKGWKVVDFEWAKYFSHIGIFKTFAIFYITILTLGVLSYWGGFFVIFEGISKMQDEKSNDEDISKNLAFQEWKRINPNHTLNDYFAAQLRAKEVY